MKFNRRQLLTGIGAAAFGSYLPDGILRAEVAKERSALVVIHLSGGYNALFSSPDAFIDKFFGVNRNTIADLGNGLHVDKMFDRFGDFAKNHMATIGIDHGISGHFVGRVANYSFGAENPLMMIASHLGGDAAIKAAAMGPKGFHGPSKIYQGVSLQTMTDMQVALETVGSIPAADGSPDRALATAGLGFAKEFSSSRFAKNPAMLKQQIEGLDAGIATLAQPTQASLDYDGIRAAYGVETTKIATLDFAAQIAAAELMIRAGTNVVAIADNQNWDTHGAAGGVKDREMMGRILPSLKTFTDRMLNLQGMNVVVVLTGEFARSTPGSNHAACTAATVMGRHVKKGTTAQMNSNATLKNVGFKRGYPEFWAYISEALQSEDLSKTFGKNTHGLIS